MKQLQNISPVLHWPAALAAAAIAAVLLYWLLALPQLEAKQHRQAQLQQELVARQQSLALQNQLPLIDKLNQPLPDKAAIITLLKKLAGPDHSHIRFTFGAVQPVMLDRLAGQVLPLTLSVAGMPLENLLFLMQDFSANLPAHVQLAGFTYEGITNPATANARLEFEIYGQPR